MHRRYSPVLLTSTALLTISVTALGVASPTQGQTLNTYGMPGVIDTPSALAPPEGQFAGTVSRSDFGTRVTLSFQPVPRLTTALRYSTIDGIDIKRGALKDRSFDVQYLFFKETPGWRPAVAVGLRDFMGTGVYSGEYLVATKSFTPRVRVSGGIGWVGWPATGAGRITKMKAASRRSTNGSAATQSPSPRSSGWRRTACRCWPNIRMTIMNPRSAAAPTNPTAS